MSSRTITPEEFAACMSKATRDRNPEFPGVAVAAPKKKPRRRRGPTQAEVEFLAVVRAQHPQAKAITPHGITLVFPDGSGDRYTPDVLVTRPDDGRPTAYEVKGGYRGPGWEQGHERFKRAKAAFPWLHLVLAEKTPTGWVCK